MENEDQVTLTANDIRSAIEIIDVAFQRGAVRGEESQYVGTVRNKLNAFLEAAVAAHAGQQMEPAEEFLVEEDTEAEVHPEEPEPAPAPRRTKK